MSDIPTRIVAGDSVSFLWESSDYPAPTWTSAWRLVGAGIALDLTEVAEGTAHRITATAAATAALAVASARGVPCTLFGTASSGSLRSTVYQGACLLLPNPLTVTGDQRGHAAATLAAIEALLEGRATKDQKSYRIGDRELERIPVPELLTLRDYYQREAQREEDAAALASGLPRRNPRLLLTRMARA
jgi:hypothetical protein